MKATTVFNPRRKERLLNAAQRKALERRVYSHGSSLEWKLKKMVEDQKEPTAVTKARAMVERWEMRQDSKTEEYLKRLRREMKQVASNLLFDSVESAIMQVEEFEVLGTDAFLPNAPAVPKANQGESNG